MNHKIAYDIERHTPKTVIKLIPLNKSITIHYDVSKFSHCDYTSEFLQARRKRHHHRYNHHVNTSSHEEAISAYDFIINIRNEFLHFISERIETPTLEHPEEDTFKELKIAAKLIGACDYFLYETNVLLNNEDNALKKLHALITKSISIPTNSDCVLCNILHYAGLILDIDTPEIKQRNQQQKAA